MSNLRERLEHVRRRMQGASANRVRQDGVSLRRFVECSPLVHAMNTLLQGAELALSEHGTMASLTTLQFYDEAEAAEIASAQCALALDEVEHLLARYEERMQGSLK